MKQTLKTILLSAALTLAALPTHAQDTETVTGILEQSKGHLALFTASEGSGDLIGYAIKAQSTLGNAILKNCLVGMPCKLDQARTRLMENTSALTFADAPSAWYEVQGAKSVGLDTLNIVKQKIAKTRYGNAHINDDQELHFKGKPVVPAIEVGDSLSIVSAFQINKQDVLLLQVTAGTSCPAKFLFATIDATGIRLTPQFGSCSEYYTFLKDSKTSISVLVAEYNPNTKTHKKLTFKYADGKVSKQ
jgi:hypothetical protein